MIYYFLLTFAVFISSVSQVLLKKAAGKTYKSKIKEYFNLPVISAYTIFLSVTFLSVICLRFIPISHVGIIDSTNYIWVPLFSKFVFKEEMSKKKILGIIMIISGIIIMII